MSPMRPASSKVKDHADFDDLIFAGAEAGRLGVEDDTPEWVFWTENCRDRAWLEFLQDTVAAGLRQVPDHVVFTQGNGGVIGGLLGHGRFRVVTGDWSASSNPLRKYVELLCHPVLVSLSSVGNFKTREPAQIKRKQ
jgi:hypothetical protein